MRCILPCFGTACFVYLLHIVSDSWVTADAADDTGKIEEELRFAIKAAKQSGSKKVAMMRLKRALEKAEKENVASTILQEAKEALDGTSKADEQLRVARAEL